MSRRNFTLEISSRILLCFPFDVAGWCSSFANLEDICSVVLLKVHGGLRCLRSLQPIRIVTAGRFSGQPACLLEFPSEPLVL